MKVSQILYSGLGGHGSVVFSMIEGDSHRKWENSLIFYGIEKTLIDYEKKCAKLHLNQASIIKKNGLDLISWRNVFRKLQDQKPDLVILHNVGVLFPVLFYCIVRSSRFILVEHTPIVSKTMKEWFFSNIASILSRKIVVLTDEYKERLIEKLIYSNKNNIKVIPNGIDLDFFKPMSRKTGPITLGMISRLSPAKDHLTLIHAVKLVVDDNPEVQLRIAGDGEMKHRISSLIKELKIEENVELTGVLNEEEIVDFMQSIDIYTHSSFSEAMSTSIMQALACGKPIVAVNTDGVNNLVKDGVTGLLFKAKDVKSLAEKIQFFIENPEIRRNTGNNSREFAKKYLSNTRMFESYSQLINH